MFLDFFLFSVASSQPRQKKFDKRLRCCQGDATTHAECWDESYSFEECCPNADCWDGDYFTYEACRGTWGINHTVGTCRWISLWICESIQAVIRSTGRMGTQAWDMSNKKWPPVTCGSTYSDPLMLRTTIFCPNVLGKMSFLFCPFPLG